MLLTKYDELNIYTFKILRGMNRIRISDTLILTAALLLLPGWLLAQSSTSKQPTPAFRYRTDAAKDTSRQCKVVPNRDTKAVSVCAVWNLTDTTERTLWSMADSNGKVAAKAGGKTVRAGVPAVRTDIAGLPRKARKRPLTFTMGGDSVRFLQLTDNIS